MIPGELVERYPSLARRAGEFVDRHPELVANLHPLRQLGVKGRRLLSVVNEAKLRRILGRMLDEEQFLSPYGIRAQVTKELSDRLAKIFLRDEQSGRRPVYGGSEKFQNDPHWRDLVLFYEYFHGDNGAGLGASHQTGWTGVVARLMQLFGYNDCREVAGKRWGPAFKAHKLLLPGPPGRQLKRPAPNGPIGWRVAPASARSAITSPIALANL